MRDVICVRRIHNPLQPTTVLEREFAPGMTVAEIVEATGVAPAFARDVVVSVWTDTASHIVPDPLRRVVRPKAGASVTITPQISGRNELALVLAVGLAVAAPYAGAAAFGASGFFGTSALGASLVTAGVTVAGSLAINQLLAPPQPRLNGGGGVDTRPTFDIGGSSNQIARYGRVPLIIGRHRVYPKKTGLPYTDIIGEDVYLHERMTFGYGPIALETLRIGETPVHLFNDVQVEFRNVDPTETLARYPELSSVVTFFRFGDEEMILYPDDIVQDNYSVALEPNVPVVRTTRNRARAIYVETAAPRGLFFQQTDGSITMWNLTYRIEYRPVGSSVWITAAQTRVDRVQREPVRMVNLFHVPEGQYEVRVTRLNTNRPEGIGSQDDMILSGIRTLQAGKLPSPPEMAEVAIRIKASDQLNGPIGDLNGIATRMVPTWTGVSWTPPAVTRHPAWHYADLLRGHMRSQPVPDSRIDIDALKTWSLEDPQRTCDYVVDTSMSVGELRNIIAASGRAKAVFRDGKYSIIRDQAKGFVKQLFTPRNSWGFSAEMLLPKEIDGFRVQVISEAADWQSDELIVYADGKNEGNATIFEPLELPGVVLPKDVANGGEAWRLARYHLAQHVLRTEVFRLSVDLEHLAVGMGDKVRIVHDMPSIGVGQGRIKSITTDGGGNLATITLDDAFDIEPQALNITIRKANGFLVDVGAFGGGLSPTLTITGTTTASGIAPGDLVGVSDNVFFDCIVKGITALDQEQATLELIPASPAVLDADVGIIPPYDALVSRSDRQTTPPKPTITRLFSGRQAALSNGGVTGDLPRIGVEIQSQAKQNVAPIYYRLRWREVGSTTWTTDQPRPVAQVVFTGPLLRQKTYEVQAQSIGRDWRTLGWTDAGKFFSFVDDGAPGIAPNFRANVLGSQALLTWDRPTRNVDFYIIRHSPNPAAEWGESITVAGSVRSQSITLPAFNGVYHIRAVNFEGSIGATSATAIVNSGALIGTVGTTLAFHPAWDGTPDGGASLVSNTVQFTGGGGTVLADWDVLDNVTALGTYGVTAPVGEYLLDDQIDLGAVQTRRVTADVRASGSYGGFELDKWGVLDSVTSLTGGAENKWELIVEISTTQETGTPVWGDWQPLLAGDYTFAQARFRLRCSQDDINVTVTVSQLTIQVGTIA